MFPNLFSIGFLHVRTYGCCMAIGFLIAWQVVTYFCKRTGRASEPLSNFVISLLIAGVVGARAAYVIEHWSSEFAAAPQTIFAIWNGGLMFYGGFILALIVFFRWCWKKHEHPLPLADLFCAVIPLAHACGRIGCFFYGCCYGRLSSSPLAVCFPRGSPAWYEQFNASKIPHSAAASLPVLPTQLFEAAALLCLFAALFFVYRAFWKTRRGLTMGVYFVGYAIIRFGMEYLRGDPRAAVGPFSIGQTISLGLFFSGILCIGLAFKKQKE